MSNGTRYAKNTAKQQQACELFKAGHPLDYIVKTIHLDFYRLRVALDREGLLEYPDYDKPSDRCPCGKLTGVKGQKFCSHEHRMEYGRQKQPNPENYVTFNCLGCGKEVTRYKKYGKGHNKYCSNDCARTHTKTRKFYAVEDLEIIFESSFECLFWSFCMFRKIPVDRADRALAIPVNGKGGYCPDFYLPQLQLYIEVKGVEDEDDPEKWAAWRERGHQLAVLRRQELEVLLTRANSNVVQQQLRIWAQEQAHGPSVRL